jgi:RNA polymerase sigma-70 factor (ECF subfamily)
VLQATLDALPEMQRRVVLLRDVEGLAALEVCNILELGETNQRVLLHRGRAKLRKALDRYMQGEAGPALRAGRDGSRGVQ